MYEPIIIFDRLLSLANIILGLTITTSSTISNEIRTCDVFIAYVKYYNNVLRTADVLFVHCCNLLYISNVLSLL